MGGLPDDMVANPGDSLAKGSITMSESLRRIRNRKVSERRDLFKMVVTICDGPDDGAIPVTEKKNRALLTLSLQTRGKPHSQGDYDKTEDSFLINLLPLPLPPSCWFQHQQNRYFRDFIGQIQKFHDCQFIYMSDLSICKPQFGLAYEKAGIIRRGVMPDKRCKLLCGGAANKQGS